MNKKQHLENLKKAPWFMMTSVDHFHHIQKNIEAFDQNPPDRVWVSDQISGLSQSRVCHEPGYTNPLEEGDLPDGMEDLSLEDFYFSRIENNLDVALIALSVVFYYPGEATPETVHFLTPKTSDRTRHECKCDLIRTLISSICNPYEIQPRFYSTKVPAYKIVALRESLSKAYTWDEITNPNFDLEKVNP